MTIDDGPLRDPPKIGNHQSEIDNSSRPWTPECVVSTPLARELIASQFPALSPAHVEPLASGWDNTVYRVNHQYVFRFPRRRLAVELLDVELRLLAVIAD